VKLDGCVHCTLPFELEDFGKAPEMAGFHARRGTDEGGDDLRRHRRAHDPRAEREDVAVIVLDHLVAGVVVAAVGGADAGQPVGGDRHARAAAADEDPPLGVHRRQRVANELGDDRVVDAPGRGDVGAEEERLVAGGADGVGDCGAEGEPSVVGGYGDLHWFTNLRTWSATFSGVYPSLA
jgi:hypothetical protein